jgi:hypothetical protein
LAKISVCHDGQPGHLANGGARGDRDGLGVGRASIACEQSRVRAPRDGIAQRIAILIRGGDLANIGSAHGRAECRQQAGYDQRSAAPNALRVRDHDVWGQRGGGAFTATMTERGMPAIVAVMK